MERFLRYAGEALFVGDVFALGVCGGFPFGARVFSAADTDDITL